MSVQTKPTQYAYTSEPNHRSTTTDTKNFVYYVNIAILMLCLMLVFWIAIKIGTIVLRVIAGLAFLICSAYSIWYIITKHFAYSI